MCIHHSNFCFVSYLICYLDYYQMLNCGILFWEKFSLGHPSSVYVYNLQTQHSREAGGWIWVWPCNVLGMNFYDWFWLIRVSRVGNHLMTPCHHWAFFSMTSFSKWPSSKSKKQIFACNFTSKKDRDNILMSIPRF